MKVDFWIIVGHLVVSVQQAASMKACNGASTGQSSADELPLEESSLTRHLVCAPEGVIWGMPRPGSQRQGLPHGIAMGSPLQVCKLVRRQDRRSVGGHWQLRQLFSQVWCMSDLVLGDVVSCTWIKRKLMPIREELNIRNSTQHLFKYTMLHNLRTILTVAPYRWW
jgi:hypothetical protein